MQNSIPPKWFSSQLLYTHTKATTSVKISPNGLLVASSSADRKTIVMNLSDLDIVQTLSEHSSGLNCCQWLDDKHLITGSDDKTIKLWDIEVGGDDGQMRIQDLRSRACFSSYEGHSKAVTSIACHPNGRDIMTCSYDGFTRLWDFDLNSSSGCPCLFSYYDTNFTPMSCSSFSPNGRYALLGRFGGSLDLHNIDRDQQGGQGLPSIGAMVRSFAGHKNMRHSVESAVHVIDKISYVLSGSEDGCLCAWQINQGRDKLPVSDIHLINDQPRRLQVVSVDDAAGTPTAAVLSFDYSPVSRLMVSGCRNGTLHLWSPADNDSFTEAPTCKSTDEVTDGSTGMDTSN